MKIVKIEKVCQACPSAWEGKLEDGRNFYCRYRWGSFSIRISEEVNGEENLEIFRESIGDEYDGVMNDSEMYELLEKAGFETKNGI